MTTTTQGVVIMRPQPVTDAMLVSSNVPEDDEAAYNPLTTYALGAMVMLLETHSVYENSLPDNLGNNPKLHPDKWTRVRATNRWRLFDGTNNSRTTQASSISYVFDPGGAVGMVAALGLVNCNSIRIRLVDAVYGTVHDDTSYPSPSPVQSNWWEFYFGEWVGGTSVSIAENLPAFPNAKLHVDLVGGPALAISLLLFGQPRTWGIGVEYGAGLGFEIYSKREVNKYGDIQLVRLPPAKRANVELVVKNTEVNPLISYLETVHADLCLFIVLRAYEAGVIYGIFERPWLILDNPQESVWDLEIIGAT
ncbi:hypothetical protein D3C71_1197100 [compost metagenome]